MWLVMSSGGPPLAITIHSRLLAGMECGLIDEEDIEEDWLRTLVDSPYPGPVREAIKSLAAEVTRI